MARPADFSCQPRHPFRLPKPDLGVLWARHMARPCPNLNYAPLPPKCLELSTKWGKTPKSRKKGQKWRGHRPSRPAPAERLDRAISSRPAPRRDRLVSPAASLPIDTGYFPRQQVGLLVTTPIFRNSAHPIKINPFAVLTAPPTFRAGKRPEPTRMKRVNAASGVGTRDE
jgi:hypothetical protein